MPSSAPDAIPSVISLMWELAPQSVLDVGAGNGKYGVLFRDYLEQRLDKAQSAFSGKRLARIDAVEGFPAYVGDLHRVTYDNVYAQRIEDFLNDADPFIYDMIYAGDVIEHLDKKAACELVIPGLLQRSRMGVLMSVPWRVKEQGAVYGNDLERHRSEWSRADFAALAPHSHVGRKGNHLLAFMSKDAGVVRRLKGRRMRRWLRGIVSAAGDSW